jgi:dTDP-4-amino-4,6-dideoxygalactose transaminase
MIRLVDLTREYPEIRDEIEATWKSIVDAGSFILGREVAAFESDFADFCEARYCIGVANGTDAIELSLRAAGIGQGDQVMVPANTFIATALAVVRAGADVVMVDCDPDTYLIEPSQVIEAAGAKTRAVIPVHLFGQIAHVEEIVRTLPDLTVIEDAAQAQGARRDGRPIGSWGVAAATSFYPAKNLGAFGDAGAVVCNDEDLAARLRNLRNWGSSVKYHHPELGFNSRLDTIQAAVLRVKLRHLASWNEKRVEAASRYGEMLVGIADPPRVAPGNEHVFHLYVIEVDRRDDVLAKLRASGIEAGVHYPVPVHLQPAFSHLGLKAGAFPNAERAAQRMLSLPMFPGITFNEQEAVVEALKNAMK